MAPDANPELGHPDAAGWALGALDPPDAEAFEVHLRDCADCQTVVAEFESMAWALKAPALAVEPPPDLETRTLAAVQYAMMTAREAEQARTVIASIPEAPAAAVPDAGLHEARTAAHVQYVPAAGATELVPSVASIQQAVAAVRRKEAAKRDDSAAEPAPAKMSRWWHWHWNFPVFSLATALGAAAAAAVAVIVVQIGQAAPALAGTVIPLHAHQAVASSKPGPSGRATAHRAAGGWQIQLTVRHLPASAKGRFYECWYAGPGNRPGHPELITAGTFTIGRSGGGTFTMWSAADPLTFRNMQITEESPGDAGQHGAVIMEGSPRPV